MAYLKPPLVTRRVLNPLARRFGLGGSTTLAVARRRSGEVQKLPVIPVELDGARYIVSTRGESDWVRNLRAAGKAELGGETVRATEVPVEQRAPIIAAYREKAGKMVGSYWAALPDPKDHPVFRLEPA
jgi:hypothetical protein